VGDVRVFVSSTYQDLTGYRAAVTRAILTGENIPDDMLYWPAEEDRALDASLRRVRASDLVVLILAHRYGTVLPGAQASITELEINEALACNIPVLAYLVDPTYDWPPPYVDIDPMARARLERFRQDIQQRVVTKSFTTPESLEVAVAHGLSRFRDRRSHRTESSFGHARARQIARPETVCCTPDALIRIGRAPDGAPLLLDIRRRISVADDLRRIATMLERTLDDPLLAEMLTRLDKEARELATSRHLATVAGKEVYVSGRALVSMVAPSLFQSALGPASPPSTRDYDDPLLELQRPDSPTMIAGLRSSPEDAAAITSMGGANRFLCVGLDREPKVWSGGWIPSAPRGTGRRLELWRPYLEEGLELLAPIRYVLRRGRFVEREVIIDTDSAERFHAGWRKVFETESDSRLADVRGSMEISRKALVDFILKVIDEAAALHRAGRLHGDIKPSNILAARHGGALIDEVPDLHLGQVSPTVTVHWSPPEQLLRRPLTAAADVYPLGRLLLEALDGEALGRVVEYRMPDDVTAEVIEDPAIYLGPDNTIVPPERHDAWCRIIEKALRTDQAQRWRDAGELADALRSAMQRCPISGWIEVGYPWGNRPALVRDENGELGIAWIVGVS